MTSIPDPSLPLALTCGDLAGVGPELIERWLAQHVHSTGKVVVFGPSAWLDTLALPPCSRGPSGDAALRPSPGKPSVAAAAAGIASLEQAARAVREGQCAGVVTAPINKAWAAQAGFSFPGQTEFFEARWGGRAVMAFAGARLRVSLATWHIPLSSVPSSLTPESVTLALEGLDALCRADRIPSPRLAVCGLNPHAGEGGLLGHEEKTWLDAHLETLRGRFPGLLGTTVPGDTAFARALRGEFDGVVALYHDQGLAPLKAVDFDDAVNVSLGMPWVRTSPDHGTAYDLAGTGRASLSSWSRAVDWARRLINARAGR